MKAKAEQCLLPTKDYEARLTAHSTSHMVFFKVLTISARCFRELFVVNEVMQIRGCLCANPLAIARKKLEKVNRESPHLPTGFKEV